MNDAQPPHPDTPDLAKLKRRTWLAALLSASALLTVGALTAGALYVVSIDRAVNGNLQYNSDQLPAETPTAKGEKPRPAKKPGKAVNYVLMGSDSRDLGNAGHGRSDVLMVMHLDADRKNAYMISFPRDMYVPIPGHGKNKINAAFSFGGPSLTVRTLESLLDTRMDHVALIDFEGFINLTEELGGVTVYNRYASNSGGYKFPVWQCEPTRTASVSVCARATSTSSWRPRSGRASACGLTGHPGERSRQRRRSLIQPSSYPSLEACHSMSPLTIS